MVQDRADSNAIHRLDVLVYHRTPEVSGSEGVVAVVIRDGEPTREVIRATLASDPGLCEEFRPKLVEVLLAELSHARGGYLGGVAAGMR